MIPLFCRGNYVNTFRGERFLLICLRKAVSAISQSLNGLLVYYDNATFKYHQPRQDVQSTANHQLANGELYTGL